MRRAAVKTDHTPLQAAFHRGWCDGVLDAEHLTAPYLEPAGAERNAAYWRGVQARAKSLNYGAVERDAKGDICKLYPALRNSWKEPQTDERGYAL